MVNDKQSPMHFEVHGLKDANAPTLVFSSGLGGAAHFWQPQIRDLSDTYRIVVYDQLGTGKSSATLPEDYTITHMAKELRTLLVHLDIKQCHIVGHALGGLVGLALASTHPALVQSLVLINAWSSPNPHTLRCFNIRKAILATGNKDIYLQMQALLLYPADWIAANAEHLSQEEAHQLRHFPNEHNLLMRIGALSAFNIEAQLADIHTPTLAIANKDDVLVPWQRSKILVSHMPNAELALMEYGGHASTITATSEFNNILRERLSQLA